MDKIPIDVLVVTATSVETKAVLDSFAKETGSKPVVKIVASKTYHDLGSVNGASVWLVRSEMGSGGLGAAQQTLSKALAALTPSAVIAVGIAFGTDPKKQKLGQVLVSKQLMLYDLQRVSTKKQGSHLVPRGDRPPASPWLLDRLHTAELSASGFPIAFGTILSGEKLVDNVDYRNTLLQSAGEAIGGEMEAAGLYVECHDAKIDWIIVKAICDWADGKKSKKKAERQRRAAKNAARFVLHALTEIPFGRVESMAEIVKTKGDGLATAKPVIQQNPEGKSGESPSAFQKFHIAHHYWMGSDLADAMRIVMTSTDKETASRCITQCLRHFRKSGFKNQDIEARLKAIGDLSLGTIQPQWSTDSFRRTLLAEIAAAKSLVDKFIEETAGPSFLPWSD